MKKILLFILMIALLIVFSIQKKSEGFSNLHQTSSEQRFFHSHPKDSEIKLEIQTPPDTQVLAYNFIRFENNPNRTDHQFIFPSNLKTTKIYVEGAFGGIIVRELKLEGNSNHFLKIPEKMIQDSSNTPLPEKMGSLPELCPRMLAKENNLVPPLLSFKKPTSSRDSIYEAKLDLLSLATTEEQNSLYLESANLKFDYEDPSILVGYNRQTGEAVYEEEGGFYSNIHYFILRYQPELEALYQSMEADFIGLRRLEQERLASLQDPSKRSAIEQEMKKHYDFLYGKDEEVGVYQLFLHALFNSLDRVGKNDLQFLSPPLAHGFIPGPFRGSSHWGYTLCEWGDTFYHSTEQKMNYAHLALWQWLTESPSEKIILVLLEGDDQLQKNEGRLDLEQKGVLRNFDYTDDLIGFFVISRNETLNQSKVILSPLQDLALQIKTVNQ